MITVERVDRAEHADTLARDRRIIRAVLAGSGLFVVCAVALGVVGAVGEERLIGPARLQVLVVGILFLAAGLITAPSTELARTIDRARRLGRLDRQRARPVARASGKLSLIVFLALAFRLWMLASYWPSNQMVMGMALWDAEMARNLVHGRGWVVNEEFLESADRAVVNGGRMIDLADLPRPDDGRTGALKPFGQYAHTPGYSAWLALSFILGRTDRFIYSQIMQCVLDSAACLLVFGIGFRLWSTRAGLLGALLYALSPAHVYLSVQTVAAATDSFWVLLLGYGIVRTWTDHVRGESPVKGVSFVVCGTVCGALMNSTIFVLPAVTAGWALLVAVASSRGWRLVGYMAAAQLFVVLLLIPWGLRNQRVYGQFALTRQTVWQLAWETLGERPNPWGLGLGPNDQVYFDWVSSHCPAPCTPAEREAVTRRDLMTRVFRSREFPGYMASLLFHRLPGLVYTLRLPIDKPYPGVGLRDQVIAIGLGAINFAVLLAIPAALFAIVLLTARGSTSTAGWLGLAPTLFVVAFSLFFFVEHRKTTPAYGYVLALAGITGAAFKEGHADNH